MRDDGPVDAGGKLLQPAEEGARADQLGSGLQYPQGRIGLHHLHQTLKRRCVDQAVGIEHDHMVVAAAPTCHEILDVARLARDVPPAAAVPHRHDAGERLAQQIYGRRFADPGIGIGRVGYHHDLEAAMGADAGERLGHRAQGRGGAHRILVVDRHEQRRERGVGRFAGLWIAMLRGAGQHRARGERDPGERHREEEDHQALQHGHARKSHYLQHLVKTVGRDSRRGGDQDEPGI